MTRTPEVQQIHDVMESYYIPLRERIEELEKITSQVRKIKLEEKEKHAQRKIPKQDSNEFYKKTDEIVSKFKNGKERYKTSALFNRAVQMLVRGAGEYEVIEQLITVTDDTQKAFEQYIHRCTPIQLISKQ